MNFVDSKSMHYLKMQDMLNVSAPRWPDMYSVRTVEIGTINIMSALDTSPLISSEEEAYRDIDKLFLSR